MAEPEFPKENSILARNKQVTREMEIHFWRALCDTPSTVRKYLSDDCIMVFPGGKLVTMKSDPSIKSKLEDMEPWTNFEMQDEPEFIEIDMMATTIAYKITLTRMHDGDVDEVKGIASTVWRQDAGGDWKCCMHHLAVLGN